MDFHARRRPRRASRLLAGALALAAFAAPAFAAPAPGAPPAWVAKSDQNTQLLLDSLARFDPEGAGELGVPGLDEQIFDLKPGLHERREAAARKVREELRRRLAAETDPRVRQDLEILIQAGDDDLKGDELGRKYNLPYSNVTQTIFGGLRALLDDQVEPARRPAALVRLRKYTGMAPGTTPLTRLAEDYTRSKLKNARLRGPFKDRIERDLANNQTVVAGIGELFKKYGIAGYEEPYARLKEQLAAYDAFLRKEMLPRAGNDFRLPPELYAYRLQQVGDRHAGRGAGAARRGGLQGDPERDGDPGAAGGAARRGSPSPTTGG